MPTLFGLFVALTLSLVRVAWAENPAQTDGGACSLAAPVPLLYPDAYPGQTFTTGPYHSAVEHAQIRTGVTLDIRSSSCADSVYYRFEFAMPRPSRNYGSTHWLRIARSALIWLGVNEEGAAVLRDLHLFLGHVTARQLQHGKVSRCRDGSMPDKDGCAWASGGGDTLEISETPHAIRIVISRDVSH